MDKILLAYFYKAPPQYDARIGEQAYKILKCAPLVGFGFAYWAFSNPAMMSNYVHIKQVKHEVTNPNYTLLPSHSTPLSGIFMFIFLAMFPF